MWTPLSRSWEAPWCVWSKEKVQERPGWVQQQGSWILGPSTAPCWGSDTGSGMAVLSSAAQFLMESIPSSLQQ